MNFNNLDEPLNFDLLITVMSHPMYVCLQQPLFMRIVVSCCIILIEELTVHLVMHIPIGYLGRCGPMTVLGSQR